ncbi:MAG TPA: thioesterase family protein [Acidimicrobiales bacterium]
MGTIRRCADPADREFFGLRFDPTTNTGTFQVLDRMSNPRGTFYGGAGVAVVATAMEAATDRRLLWITAQFSDGAARGDELRCHVEVMAHGRRTSQVRATVTNGDTTVLTALGATGEGRDDVAATFDRMPAVRPPEMSPAVELDLEGDVARSRFAVTEHRVAADLSSLEGTGTHIAWWCRVEGLAPSAPTLAYVSDLLVFGVAQALGRPAVRATSLDNTLRVGSAGETEWMLLDLRAQSTSDGFAHGFVNIWSPDGVLLATASQSFALRSGGATGS